jgi:uncharacterized protein (DUF58 family)
VEGFGGSTQILVISLVVAGIVAMIQTNDNVRGIEITACRAEPVAAGEEALLALAVTNVTDRERLGLKVRFREGWKLKGAGEIPVLRGRETRNVELRIPTSRRGAYPIPSVWVSSVSPVGLCFAWKIFPGRGNFYVFPRGRSWKPVPEETGQEGRAAGKGIEDVSGHRAYAAGDLLSRVDWRVFARTEKLAVRTFEGNGKTRALLRWEDTAFLEDREERLEQLSFWISECAVGKRPFDLVLGGAACSERNLAGCRIALATFRGDG